MASGLQKMKLGRKYPQVPPPEMDEIINLFACVPRLWLAALGPGGAVLRPRQISSSATG
jgi:hypothetical protein